MPHGAELSATTRLPFLKPLTSGTDFFDDAGQFVAKQRRRNDHAGVIAALIDLQIGAACERDVYLDQYFPFVQHVEWVPFRSSRPLCRRGQRLSFVRSL